MSHSQTPTQPWPDDLQDEESRRKHFSEAKLKLFLSADISGSTAFKSSNDPRRWFGPIAGFHNNFPKQLYEVIQKVNSLNLFSSIEACLAAPRIWKTLGDEIVFEIDIPSAQKAQQDPRVYWYVSSFLRTMEDYVFFSDDSPTQNENNKKISDLGIKGTAWLAGFPVQNREVPTQVTQIPKGLVKINDFFGPDIDIGFRLSGFSSTSLCTVSLGLAGVLAAQSHEDINPLAHQHGEYKIWLLFKHKAPLKGILGGSEYPIFQAYLHENEIIGAEASLSGMAYGAEASGKATKYLNLFRKRFASHMIKPFGLEDLLGDPALVENYKPKYDKAMQDLDQYVSTDDPDPQQTESANSQLETSGKELAMKLKKINKDNESA